MKKLLCTKMTSRNMILIIQFYLRSMLEVRFSNKLEDLVVDLEWVEWVEDLDKELLQKQEHMVPSKTQTSNKTVFPLKLDKSLPTS